MLLLGALQSAAQQGGVGISAPCRTADWWPAGSSLHAAVALQPGWLGITWAPSGLGLKERAGGEQERGMNEERRVGGISLPTTAYKRQAMGAEHQQVRGVRGPGCCPTAAGSCPSPAFQDCFLPSSFAALLFSGRGAVGHPIEDRPRGGTGCKQTLWGAPDYSQLSLLGRRELPRKGKCTENVWDHRITGCVPSGCVCALHSACLYPDGWDGCMLATSLCQPGGQFTLVL